MNMALPISVIVKKHVSVLRRDLDYTSPRIQHSFFSLVKV